MGIPISIRNEKSLIYKPNTHHVIRLITTMSALTCTSGRNGKFGETFLKPTTVMGATDIRRIVKV